MLRGFSWKQGICRFSTVVPRHHASALVFRICLENQPTRLNRDNRRPANIAFSVPLRSNTKYRNINLFPIDYAFRPRLRGRLTLPRLNVGQEPLVFRRAGFSPALSLLMSAFALLIPPATLTRPPSQAYRTLPYPTTHSVAAAASVHGLAPLHLPRRPTRPVSYYALFNGWLLLSQHPGCL